LKTYPVDFDRIYVYGQSMGAFATWDILCRRPETFAGAVAVCGGGDECCAAAIAAIPVWVFHGALDDAVKVERSRNMVAALRRAGGQPHYTEYPDVAHNAWDYAYTPELFHWLFQQHRVKIESVGGGPISIRRSACGLPALSPETFCRFPPT